MINSAYICDAIRTPFGRYGGVLSSVRPDDLGAIPLRALQVRNPSIDWSQVDDVIFGCANQAGEDNRNVARMSALLANLPISVPGVTVNRLCGSGLDAISQASRAIAAGQADLVVAGGVESMSRAPYVISKSEQAFSRSMQLEDTTIGWRFVNPEMESRFGVDSMPETAENVADRYDIVRADQDAFAARSQQRYAEAHGKGYFGDEIVSVQVRQGRGDSISVNDDEHPRPGTKAEDLGRLRPIVREGGTITAGNASGVNDGACALIVASEESVKRFGLNPIARIVGSAVAGVEPSVMGMGPVPASQKLLERLGLRIDDMDVIELNEAFAAQSLACLRELGLPDDAPQVNPNGGAIAIGHPLGASGARLATTAIYQLLRTGGRYALCTMCIGVGQGIATVFERA